MQILHYKSIGNCSTILYMYIMLLKNAIHIYLKLSAQNNDNFINLQQAHSVVEMLQTLSLQCIEVKSAVNLHHNTQHHSHVKHKDLELLGVC